MEEFTATAGQAKPYKLPISPNSHRKFADDDDSYWNSFPPGYRFCPFDSELIVHYLKKKIQNQALPRNKINDVNLYRFNPHDLAEMYKSCGGEKGKEYYFFTPRDRKYKNGRRPNRAAGDGYWKATGADKIILHKGETVGFKKTLVFYQGKPPKGIKTCWIMHEYRDNNNNNNDTPTPVNAATTTDMRLDDWVLCRIRYKKNKGKSSKQTQNEDISCAHQGTNNNNNNNNNNNVEAAAAAECNESVAMADLLGYEEAYGGGYLHNVLQQTTGYYYKHEDPLASLINIGYPFQQTWNPNLDNTNFMGFIN